MKYIIVLYDQNLPEQDGLCFASAELAEVG